MNSGPTGSVMVSRRIWSIFGPWQLPSSEPASHLVDRLQTDRGTTRAPQGCRDALGPASSGPPGGITRLPKRCAKGGRACPRRPDIVRTGGFRNFGSERLRSSPPKTVFACIRPDQEGRGTALPYPSIVIPMFLAVGARRSASIPRSNRLYGGCSTCSGAMRRKPFPSGADRKVTHSDGSDFPLREQHVHCFPRFSSIVISGSGQ